MTALSARPFIPAEVRHGQRALAFKAWTVAPESEGNPRHEAQPVDLPDWIEDAETAAMVACNCLSHKSAIMVLRSDAAERPERRNLWSFYTVRRRSHRRYVRGLDGQPQREPEFYPDPVMQVCMAEGSAPIEPWTMDRGNPVGVDLTLVDAK